MNNINKILRFFTLFFMLALTACANLNPKQQASTWQLYNKQNLNFNAHGRLSVKIDNKGSHGNFDWENRYAKLNLIDINSPIGNTIGQLCKDQYGVVITNDKGQTYLGDNSVELSEQLLGFKVPLDNLDIWSNGYIANNSPYKIQNNKLYQNGWIIELTKNKNNSPRKVVLSQPNLTIQVIFDEYIAENITMQSKYICPQRNHKL